MSAHDVQDLANSLRAELAGARATLRADIGELRAELAAVRVEQDHCAKHCKAAEGRIELKVANEVNSLRSELTNGAISLLKEELRQRAAMAPISPAGSPSAQSLPAEHAFDVSNIVEQVLERVQAHEIFRHVGEQYSNLMETLLEVMRRQEYAWRTYEETTIADNGMKKECTEFAGMLQSVSDSTQQDYSKLSSRVANLEHMLSSLCQVNGLEDDKPKELDVSDITHMASPDPDRSGEDLTPSPRTVNPRYMVAVPTQVHGTDVGQLEGFSSSDFPTREATPRVALEACMGQMEESRGSLGEAVSRLQALSVTFGPPCDEQPELTSARMDTLDCGAREGSLT